MRVSLAAVTGRWEAMARLQAGVIDLLRELPPCGRLKKAGLMPGLFNS